MNKETIINYHSINASNCNYEQVTFNFMQG